MGNRSNHIRYYVSPDDSRLVLPNLWTVCIINNHSRELEEIKNKMLYELAPMDGYEELSNGPIKKSGGLHHLAYKIFSEYQQLEPDQ